MDSQKQIIIFEIVPLFNIFAMRDVFSTGNYVSFILYPYILFEEIWK